MAAAAQGPAHLRVGWRRSEQGPPIPARGGGAGRLRASGAGPSRKGPATQGTRLAAYLAPLMSSGRPCGCKATRKLPAQPKYNSNSAGASCRALAHALFHACSCVAITQGDPNCLAPAVRHKRAAVP